LLKERVLLCDPAATGALLSCGAVNGWLAARGLAGAWPGTGTMAIGTLSIKPSATNPIGRLATGGCPGEAIRLGKADRGAIDGTTAVGDTPEAARTKSGTMSDACFAAGASTLRGLRRGKGIGAADGASVAAAIFAGLAVDG